MATSTHSGLQHLHMNFRERVVSDDFNRAQQFAAAALAELLRRTGCASASSATSGGKETAASAILAPARGLILSGLRARPEIGTVNLFVEAGSAVVVFPEAAPHPADSPARLIHDPGSQVAGDLTLTAGGGGTRIDVVECAPTQTVTEADNRDIFDPSTGLFAPVLVDKVSRGSLAYRIRLGTPGAGFPGVASGWLPLAVCSVPSSAATWDDVTVWDVRPLQTDLTNPPHLLTESFPALTRVLGQSFDDGTHWQARGLVDGSLDGWKVGGELAASSSGASYLDLQTATVKEAGFAAVPGPWYLYLLLPFGLPRWCRLNAATTGNRDPGALRGIPVLSQKDPVGLSGRAGSAIALPTGTGLGGTTTIAGATLSGIFGTGAAFLNVAAGGDGWALLGEPGIAHSPSAGNDTSAPVYTLVGGASFPPHATAVRLRFQSSFGLASGTTVNVTRTYLIQDPVSGATQVTRVTLSPMTALAGNTFSVIEEIELPLTPSFPAGASATWLVGASYVAAGATFDSQFCSVVGWKLT